MQIRNFFAYRVCQHCSSLMRIVIRKPVLFHMLFSSDHMSLVVRKPALCIYAKTKTQISFAVTAKLISAFVFATRIVQSLYFLNMKFQVSSHLVWLYSLVCVGPGRKPRRPVFSERGSYNVVTKRNGARLLVLLNRIDRTQSWTVAICRVALLRI